ncbi:Alpha-agarase precursor [Limihaloglobus sulfuriphilus]|uniref:Alpha-agarase n=1 Tax=Limihaloglobus sulfuriphilus TaxID=1851148 RepID=A0A1R7T673_9BACT|nr:dockerin type I domain-containing protein [Limihaloglobus sulfuriphilus]AQQ72433.1 Alpha-agarase precursor [Limihaloglobus sulfuriphilus]
MQCPWNIWAGDGPRLYSHWDNHGAFTHFVRNHRELFDDYRAYSQVGLLWNTDSVMDELDSFGAALYDMKIAFDIVPLGERYPRRTIDVNETASKYDKIVQASDLSSWSQENQVLVNELGEEVDIVSHPNGLSLDNGWINVTPLNAPKIWVLPRKHTSDILAPIVVHVLNRDYDSSTDSVDNTGCSIEFDRQMLKGMDLESVEWLGPQNPTTELAVTETGSGFQVSLPQTPAWSLLKINVSYIPGDFNADGSVDMLDLDVIAAEWLSCSDASNPQCQGQILQSDSNSDGYISYLDFVSLWQGWQQ